MKYTKKDLLSWLKDLNQSQFEEVIMMVLDRDEQAHLSKPVNLIDRANFLNDAMKMDKKKEIAHYLERQFSRYRPKIRHLHVSKDPSNLPFLDRVQEIANILYQASAPYLILDAPIGYGKTALLKHLKFQFVKTDWNTLYVELNGNETSQEACEILVHSLPSNPKLKVDVPIEDATGSEVCKMAQAKPGAGVVLLIDFAGFPSPELVLFLANTLLKAISDAVVSGVRQYPVMLNPFRVILAGRYSMAWQSLIPFALPFTWLSLPPFDFATIRNATYLFLREPIILSIDQVAAHTFYLTGGHPGLITNILVDYKNVPIPPDHYFDVKDGKIWLNWISNCVDTIHRELLGKFPKLRDVIDLISIFRVLDIPCLQEIVNSDRSKTFRDCYHLQEVLTQTNAFQFEPRLVNNCLVRRLLAIRMWRTDPEHFSKLTLAAQKFCLDNIAHTPAPREVWAVEFLYQFLHQFAPKVQEKAQRDNLRETFIRIAVPSMMDAYLGIPGLKPQQRRGDIIALKEQLKRDWEFQFTINYYLRENQYDNSQFQKLIDLL